MNFRKSISDLSNPLANPLLWTLFVLYVVIAGYGIVNHEMWGDEIHSWNIAKGSGSYVDLIHNTRYEGHPPVWYTILWTISKFTHDLHYVQAVHLTIAAASVFLILFFSPLPLTARLLAPFGYFFLYEYAVLSRNYAIAVLLALCICLIMRKEFRYKPLLYYALLLLLTNVHLLALLLAGSLHLYYLLYINEQKKKRNVIALHILLGILVALPALKFIFPPSDSQLNVSFWLSKWSIQQVTTFGQAPLRAFIPMPAWWNYSFWHTQFLLEAKENLVFFKILNPLIALATLLLSFLILKSNRKSLLLFITNLVLSFIIAVVAFPLTSARYAGFVFIAFIISYWLYCYETPVTSKNKWLIGILLAIQLPGGLFAVAKDIVCPFSNAYKVGELLQQVPANEKIVTDYWAMNTVSAFTEKQLYCIDLQKEVSFILWGSDMAAMQKNPYRYTEGIKKYFEKEKINKLYMVSSGSIELLNRVDVQFAKAYRVKLVDKREGAIEKGGNIYLYEINSF